MFTDVFHELCDIRYQYADAVDRMDWVQYRSIFADRLMVAATSSLASPAVEYEAIAADEWVHRVSTLIEGLAATQHSMFNPRALIDGPRAVLTTYMRADHFLNFENKDDWYAIGGYYRDDLLKTADGWKIERLRLNLFWQRGDSSILAQARAAVASGNPAARITQ
jgi:hypothetical protein